MKLKKLFGERLRELRNSRRLTQQELADLSDLQLNSISQIEIGKNAVSFAALERITKALDVNYDELFSFNNDSSNDKTIIAKRIYNRLLTFDTRALENIEQIIKSIEKIKST